MHFCWSIPKNPSHKFQTGKHSGSRTTMSVSLCTGLFLIYTSCTSFHCFPNILPVGVAFRNLYCNYFFPYFFLLNFREQDHNECVNLSGTVLNWLKISRVCSALYTFMWYLILPSSTQFEFFPKNSSLRCCFLKSSL